MVNVSSVILNNGLSMPIVGLGTWNSPPGEVERAVKWAIDSGYRSFDCAAVYRNEAEVGSALAAKIAESVVKRSDLFVTSKLWNTFHDPKSVRKAIERTLSDLKLEYLDLYLIHWPMSYLEDGDNLFPKDANGEFIDGGVDYNDTWHAMEELVNAGLTKSIGVSNFNAAQIDRLVANAKIMPVTNQVECHPYLNQIPLKDHCQMKNIFLTAYAPLGSPQRPWAVQGEPQLMEEPKVVEIAKKHKKNSAQILLRYQVQRGVIVIPKSITKERIESNIEVFDFNLNLDEMATIDAFNRNGRLCPELGAVNHQYHPFKNDEY